MYIPHVHVLCDTPRVNVYELRRPLSKLQCTTAANLDYLAISTLHCCHAWEYPTYGLTVHMYTKVLLKTPLLSEDRDSPLLNYLGVVMNENWGGGCEHLGILKYLMRGTNTYDFLFFLTGMESL